MPIHCFGHVFPRFLLLLFYFLIYYTSLERKFIFNKSGKYVLDSFPFSALCLGGLAIKNGCGCWTLVLLASAAAGCCCFFSASIRFRTFSCIESVVTMETILKLSRLDELCKRFCSFKYYVMYFIGERAEQTYSCPRGNGCLVLSINTAVEWSLAHAWCPHTPSLTYKHRIRSK